MRRRALRTAGAAVAALALGAAVGAGAASAADVGVAIPGQYFAPARVQVLVGDTVTWHNDDQSTHDIVAADGSFDSGLLTPGASFSHAYDAAGAHPYLCTIHRGMRGEVDVVDLALQAPAGAPVQGERFALRGRAQAGSGPVTLERAGPDGAFAAVATVDPAADGSFSAPVTADATADWRAVAGGAVSPTVRVAVAPRVEVRVRVRAHGPLAVLSVATIPARPQERVVLQLYSREHFLWRRSEVARLDQRGRTTFSLERDRPHRARVLYAPAGGGAAVVSRPVRVAPRRPAGGLGRRG